MSAKIKYLEPLVNHLLAQNSSEAMEKALNDLLTVGELADVANRLQIIEMLQQGIPQRQIADKLGVGIATVTRGSHHLKRSSD
jgi:TrpR family trp operon transcriptional repressor